MARLDDNIIVAAKLENKLVKSVSEIEEEIFVLVKKILRQFDIKDGQIVPDDRARLILSTLNKEIRKIINKVAVEDEVSAFIDDFDLIDKNIKAVQQQLNGIEVPKSIFNAQRQWAIDATLHSLVESNINLKFVQPVKQLLYSRVAFGGSVVDAERQLRRIVLGDQKHYGVLKSWIGQIARDTINEYQGTINQQIKVQYELNAVRYIGGLVEDSRPQCVRWVKKLGGVITDEQMEAEIRWAYAKGTGMKPDTTPENFCQKRGGYNCRHDAIPVRR